MRKSLSLGLLAVVLSSCTVGPDYHRPQIYRDEEISKNLGLNPAEKMPISKDWYTQFNDPVLNELVALSLKDSPDVKIAVQKLRQARNEFDINAFNYFPMIDVDGSYHYNKPSRKIGYTIDTDYYQTGLDASWELDIWGGGRRLTESQQALMKAAAADLDNVYVSLAAETASDYISLCSLQVQLKIAEQNLELQQKIYDIVKRKNQVGLEDNVALNQAQYAIETTKTLIPDLQQSISEARNALAILTGRLPGQLDDLLSDRKSNLVRKRFRFDLDNIYKQPASVIRLRPDVRTAEQQLIAQNALVGQEISKLFPNVSLSGFLGFQALEVSGLVGDKSFMYTYSPAVTLPLLHWGQLQNQVELQKNVTVEYFYRYQNSILTAAEEIKNSMSAVGNEYKKNLSAYGAAASQRKVTAMTLEKYKRGLIEFNDVLTAEQNLLSAQNNLAASNGKIYQNIIAYYKAVGGGYAKDAPEFCSLYKSSLLNGTPCKAL